MNVEKLLESKGAEVATVAPHDTVTATARLLSEQHKGLALVCGADDKLLGVASVIDITRAVGAYAEQAAAMPVEAIMTTDYVSCRLEDSVEDVLRKMTERHVRHLPVVEDGVLKGLVNIRDVLDVRFEEAKIEVEEMRKYVFGVGYH